MLTRPADLPDACLREVLRASYGFLATSLTYEPVGFGSHHWLAADASGDMRFVTVDDLDAKLRSADDTTDAAYDRLERAFATALSLRRDAGLPFVVAPVPAGDGRVLSRVERRYSLVVHPVVAGHQTGCDGEFDDPADAREVLYLLITLHAARADAPPAHDFAVPWLADLTVAMAQTSEPWQDGPYGRRVRDLLARNATDLTALLAAYEAIGSRVAARPDRMVITHGEPHSANVLRTTGGLVLVDWDTALLAPPERDLWVLADADPSIPAAYAAVTGSTIDHDALTLYRLEYDLAEIAGYVHLFRCPHGDTADCAESWRNLQHFLRPAERWPDLLAAVTSDAGN